MHSYAGMKSSRRKRILPLLLVAAVLPVNACSTAPPDDAKIALGTAFRTFHVYAQPGTAAAFVDSWIATFGGHAQPPANDIDLTPYPSKATAIMVSSPVAALSVYDFSTGIPYPFGSEVSGWGVTGPRAAPDGHSVIVRFPGGYLVEIHDGQQTPLPENNSHTGDA